MKVILQTIDELKKAQVKGFIRYKKGKMERVSPYSRTGTFGSQKRESLETAGYELVSRKGGREVILKEKDTGKYELWGRKDDFAGYTIDIGGKGYEFIRGVDREVQSPFKASPGSIPRLKETKASAFERKEAKEEIKFHEMMEARRKAKKEDKGNISWEKFSKRAKQVKEGKISAELLKKIRRMGNINTPYGRGSIENVEEGVAGIERVVVRVGDNYHEFEPEHSAEWKKLERLNRKGVTTIKDKARVVS